MSPSGKDEGNPGTELDSPFESLLCACNPDCNKELQTGEVICLLAGTYDVFNTIYVKGAGMREKSLKVMALGPDRSAVLDGNGQVPIFNSLQTNMHFSGIHFTNGKGTSGGAVYGERGMIFENCLFSDNEATVHGGAVMGGRGLRFTGCEFRNNAAKFAGALRINDIGNAVVEDSLFIGNTATGRGGGLVTQIEKPENTVEVKNTLFCFNESPMSPHIYNYRSTTHQCTKCRFNSKDCCNGNGRVVAIEDADFYTVPEGATRTRVCQCAEGWSGERCEVSAAAGGGGSKDEL